MINKSIRLISLFLVLVCPAFAEEMPACLKSDPKAGLESVITAKNIRDQELLARLVFAEGLSTRFIGDQLVYDAIAWGVMNRVRLGESSKIMRRAYGHGIYGVIFKKGQFNPAVSEKSPFSKAFLCPDHAGHWRMANNASAKAITGADNPFIRTSWEKQHALSLVVNFYYPQSVQAKGKLAPWEGNKSLSFIGDVLIDGKVLPAERIRFYRLKFPPKDIKNN
jgi:hypothetical protein